MQKVLLIEPDRTVAKCIKDELIKHDIAVEVASNGDEAIGVADSFQPEAVITELSLAGHSGTEFIYEFRTYSDWINVPIIIFSSMKLPDVISDSHDWKELNIAEIIYKPEQSLEQLASSVEAILSVKS